MTDISSAFHEKYQTSELVVLDTSRWRWSLRPVQSTLGASLLSVRSHARSWAEIDTETSAEMLQILKVMESTIVKTFGASKINYVMLMMVDPLLHFHILPRYKEERELFGETWADAAWPGPPNLGGPDRPMATLQGIRGQLRRAINGIAEGGVALR